MANEIRRMCDCEKPTPMMQQYMDVKANYPDTVLMYRLGDFFEMFFEDAVTVSSELELTLTGRECGEGRRAAMCGVPFHKADLYVGKLVERGHKVAICEQTEDPAAAQGLVRREIVRVVTPGTVTDGALLNDRKNNYIAALRPVDGGIAMAFADISTGQVYATVAEGEDAPAALANELGVYQPKEVLLSSPLPSAFLSAEDYLKTALSAMVAMREDLFSAREAVILTGQCFGKDASALSDRGALEAVGALLSYIRQTQMCDPSFVRELTVYSGGQYMELDYSTRRNLELLETMRTKEKKGSLLWVLDETQTAMGARLLRAWLAKPLLQPSAILLRQGAVGELAENLMCREELREQLSHVLDLERLMARVAYGTANAKDLRAVCQSISCLPAVREKLESLRAPRFVQILREFDALEDICALLSEALVDEPPFTVREGGMIRDSYHKDVDYLRSVQAGGKGWMEQIELQEKEETGIKNLRVGFNKVFGYYIEVTKSQTDMVPERYIRKQTLTGCERYITQELKDMEATILGAEDKLCALEYAIFTELRDRVNAAAARIQKAAAFVAETDVYAALADVAVKNRYVCPEVDLSDELYVKDGRHPVVEKFTNGSYFVPNDTQLNTAARRLMLITGPNMAGKSTYMRQVALIVILAQIGSFVPAAEARVGIVDKVFTRVGASDDLASGQSTFMLEMTEVANILKNATRRSLIVYDEVGRGTSTYDGMSIARAVVEYTASRKLGAKTLFATHYHELTVLEGACEGVVNYHIAAKKREGTIVFLRKIVPGATDDSYGIDVAKLAGVPTEVVSRARKILLEIEGGEKPQPKKHSEMNGFDMVSAIAHTEAEEAAELIRATDINTLTPIEAINLIYDLKKIIKT